MEDGIFPVYPNREYPGHQLELPRPTKIKRKLPTATMFALAVRRAAPRVASKQQKRGFVDYLVNYPDKVSDLWTWQWRHA